MSRPDTPAEAVFTVSSLTAAVRRRLEADFRSVWVRGEVSGFTAAASGHFYFSLKDDGAQLKAAWFAGARRGSRVQPRNGMEILARGRLSVYEPRGEYQLIVAEVVDVGQGDLFRAFEELRDRLSREGLFAPERKRPLPLLPARVGVVTSPDGAAIRDIIEVLRRRNCGVQLVIHPCRVQGTGAAAEIAAGLAHFGRVGGVDVVITGRGGGSLEDLWAFNEEVVARAIAACPIPVISAVGHETDFTIADFTADLRAPTPSAAAEMVAGAADELAARVAHLYRGLERAWERTVDTARHRLERLTAGAAFPTFRHRLATLTQAVDERQLRLQHALAGGLAAAQRRSDTLATRLAAHSPQQLVTGHAGRLDLHRRALANALRRRLADQTAALALARGRLVVMGPQAVLDRGYAICLDRSGRALRNWRDTQPADPVRVLLARGELACRVEGTAPKPYEEEP